MFHFYCLPWRVPQAAGLFNKLKREKISANALRPTCRICNFGRFFPQVVVLLLLNGALKDLLKLVAQTFAVGFLDVDIIVM